MHCGGWRNHIRIKTKEEKCCGTNKDWTIDRVSHRKEELVRRMGIIQKREGKETKRCIAASCRTLLVLIASHFVFETFWIHMNLRVTLMWKDQTNCQVIITICNLMCTMHNNKLMFYFSLWKIITPSF